MASTSSDVFAIDCPGVWLDSFEELDELAPEDGGLHVIHEQQR
jgi:hypothetical protein